MGLALGALASPSLARAQFGAEAADARALHLYEQGDAAYTAGDFQAAARDFLAAYRLSPRPLLLFNLANAYERLERYTEAADTLEQYLPDAPIAEHAEVRTRIENLRRLADPNAAPAETSGSTSASSSSSSSNGGGGGDLLVPGIVLAAVGGAMVVTGAVFGALVLDGRAGLDDACRDTPDGRLLCTNQASVADDETFALITDIGLIGGGAVAAVGLALIIVAIVTDDGGGSARAPTLLPSLAIGPDGAQATLAGSF